VSDGLRTRFAPSPTGHLHVGGARTALFSWALARHEEGRFLLRIEDTDRARSSSGAVEGILTNLAWLGLAWDEGPEFEGLGGDPRDVGPFFQSERRARYDAAIEKLLAEGKAYPAFETPETLEAMRAEAQREKRTFRYVRPPEFDAAAARVRVEAGEPHVVRFHMPLADVTVEDRILGNIHFPADQLDDFVLCKRDGFPTFHLAVVVDDDAMGVTHVVRGQDHVNNTPKHMALQRALGIRVPVFAHLPILQNPDGSKMGKRDKDKAAREQLREALARDEEATRERLAAVLPWERIAPWLGDKKAQLETADLDALAQALGMELPGITVEDFRRGGYLPGVMINFLALLGWSPGEKTADGKDLERFDAAYLCAHFGLGRIGKANARFDREKLLAFNQETLQALPPEEFATRCEAWISAYAPGALDALDPAVRGLYFEALQPRSRTLADPAAPDGPGRFALIADDAVSYDAKAVAKWLAKGDPSGFERLREVRGVLESLDPFTPDAIEAAAAAFCEARSIGMGKVAQPLRVAVTGSAASPPLGATLAILGQPTVLARIDRCLTTLG
jgi:glutamyl/glutaminyl-tRNA synthetase